MEKTVRVQAAGLTDTGRQRSSNQDYFLIAPSNDVFLVTDGMGGHASGDVASRMAAENVMAELQFAGAGDVVSRVEEAVRQANGALYEINTARDYVPGTGMGTTLAGVWLTEKGRAVVFHVGDCRVYRYSQGELYLLTRDHSLHQAWHDGGRQGPEPKRHLVLRAVGPWENVEPEISIQDIQPGDTFLICSDGLSGMLSDAQIAAALEETAGDSLQHACSRLVAAANERGGRDNIAVLLVNISAL